jgi:hypothetical protein
MQCTCADKQIAGFTYEHGRLFSYLMASEQGQFFLKKIGM